MITENPRTVGFFAALSRQRLPIAVLMVVVIAAALVVLLRMPLQLLPEIRYPQIRVIGDYPGRTAKVVEESVNQPLEEAFAGIEGLLRMESRSGDGRMYIELFFQPGHDLDRGLQDALQGIGRARAVIPPEFPDPRVFQVGTTELPVMQIAFSSPSVSPQDLRARLRADVLPRLRNVRGVEAAFVAREDNRELVVELDPARMEAAGVLAADAERVLFDALAPPVDGAIRSPDFEGVGTLAAAEWDIGEISALPVMPRAPGARPVPLGAIAGIRHAGSEDSLRTRLDGDRAVLLTVHRTPRANAVRMANRVRAAVERAAADPALADVRAEILFDDSLVTAAAARNVGIAAAAGSFLAMLLILLGLRHRSGVAVVGFIVLAGLSGSVLVLHALGQSLNLLTMAGLLLSVGLGLDYAIIFFDRLERLAAANADDARSLAARAAAGVVGPLIGAVVTTLGAILPFLWVDGLIALLFRPLILTVAVAAVLTFLFAMAALPAFSPRRQGDGIRAARPVRKNTPPAWRTPAAMGAAAVLTLALGTMLVAGPRVLPFEVLPVVDDGFIEARLTHSPSVAIEELDLVSRNLERRFAEIPGTRAVFSSVGGYFREGIPSFRPGNVSYLIKVDAPGGFDSVSWADAARRAVADAGIPGIRFSINTPRIRGVETRLADADVIVVLTRPDGDLLALGDDERAAMERMREVGGLIDIERMRAGVSPRWQIRPDRERLAMHGIQENDVRTFVGHALEGRILRQRIDRGEPLALRVRHSRDASGPDRVLAGRLAAPDGTAVHLADLAEFALVEEPTHIERREQQRVVRIAATLDPAVPGPERTLAALENALNATTWQPGTSWWTEGEVQSIGETRRTFAIAIAMALFFVFAWLLVQFRSAALALSVLLVLPLCGGGAFLLLWLLDRPVDALVLAGLLIAIGIAANNAILVLSQAGDYAADLTPIQRLRAAGRDRLRPVALTTASTVIGMSPLLLGGGGVSSLLQPLAISLTGALLVSIPLACLVLPSVAGALQWLAASFARNPDDSPKPVVS